MTIIWNFFKFMRGAILMIKRNGLSGIGIGYRYWLNTSPFVAQLQSAFSKNEYKKYEIHVEETLDNVNYETHRIDKELRKNIEKRLSDLNLDNQPLVSIIISTYDKVGLLEKCIKSIETKTTYKNYEIIIVTNNTDNNSKMRLFLSKSKYPVKIYEGYYSFSAVNNFGASLANGDFYLFLNDDTEIISKQWIESLLMLGLEKDVGAVGGKLVYPNGKLQEAGSIIWRNGNAWNYGKESKSEDYRFNYVREVDYCSASLLLVKKDVFTAIGGFDTRYTPAYWEDTDLCLKIKKKGFKVLYQPLCEVIHEGGKSTPSLGKNIQSLLLENKKKFIEVWSDYLANYPSESSDNLRFAINKKTGYDILYIDHKIPEYDNDAGSLRTFSLLSILSTLNHKVTFWPIDLQKREPYTTEIQQRGIEVIYGVHKLPKFLNENKKFKIVILSRPDVSIRIIDLIRKKLPQCKIIYDSVDLQFLSFASEGENEKNNTKLIQSNKMHEVEVELMKKSDITIFTSYKEHKIMSSEIKDLRSVVIPNIHIIHQNLIGFEDRKDLLFVGSFNHRPNVKAVQFFTSQIFPLITAKIPNIKLYIVGSNPTEVIQSLNSENVIVTGYVEDISKFFSNCKALVAPLLFGAGIKGKISESLSYSLPVVTTSIGAEGMKLTDGENCMISDDLTNFASKVIQVYTKKELWSKLSKNGLAHAENNYSPELIRSTVKKMFKIILG